MQRCQPLKIKSVRLAGLSHADLGMFSIHVYLLTRRALLDSLYSCCVSLVPSRNEGVAAICPSRPPHRTNAALRFCIASGVRTNARERWWSAVRRKDFVRCPESGSVRFSEVANVLQLWYFQSVTRQVSVVA